MESLDPCGPLRRFGRVDVHLDDRPSMAQAREDHCLRRVDSTLHAWQLFLILLGSDAPDLPRTSASWGVSSLDPSTQIHAHRQWISGTLVPENVPRKGWRMEIPSDGPAAVEKHHVPSTEEGGRRRQRGFIPGCCTGRLPVATTMAHRFLSGQITGRDIGDFVGVAFDFIGEPLVERCTDWGV